MTYPEETGVDAEDVSGIAGPSETVAVKETDWPSVAGFGLEVSVVVSLVLLRYTFTVLAVVSF
jgi:hypothetical protein